MTRNTLFIDDKGRAHVLVVPPHHLASVASNRPFREAPFVLVTGRLREGQVIEITDYKRGPYLRARGNLLDRALFFSDVATLAADLDAEVVRRHEDLDHALDDVREAYREERSKLLAATTMASTAHRSAAAFASA